MAEHHEAVIMRLSTRRSISRAAVLGLLSTTPLIAGWAAAGSDHEPAPRTAVAPSAPAVDGVTAPGGDLHPELGPDIEASPLTAFEVLDRTWLDVAPAIDETLARPDEVQSGGDERSVRSGAPDGLWVNAVDPVLTAGLTAADIAAIDTSEVTVTIPGDDEHPVGDDERPVRDEEPPVYVTVDGESITAARIHAFLDGRNAPMTDQAEAILAAGIAHDVDPRVVVGIAIAESNAGERLPVGSHNAWGWGGSGKFGLAHWGSWDEALDTYTGRLGALYDTDDVDRSFAETYCPPNWRWWLDTVTWVIDEI